jgi:hypothetical protein
MTARSAQSGLDPLSGANVLDDGSTIVARATAGGRAPNAHASPSTPRRVTQMAQFSTT